MNFNDWTNEKYMIRAYEAGAASRQGEIDELNGCVEGWKSEYNSMRKRFERSQEINKELQKRIDEALEILEYNEYVDSPMQAEADSRVNKERPDVLNSTDSIQLEWQPDWSQAPVKTVAWRKTEYNEFEWLLELRGKLYYNGKAPDFSYIGNWQDSLRKRP